MPFTSQLKMLSNTTIENAVDDAMKYLFEDAIDDAIDNAFDFTE